jgi:hypothetical protein
VIAARPKPAFSEIIVMPRSLCFASLVLFSAICCAASELAPTQQAAPQTNDPDDVLEILKLDSVILDALKPLLKDTPLQKLQRERCHERAIALAGFRENIEIGKWEPPCFTLVIKLTVALTDNLLELMEKPEDKIKCYELRVEFLKLIENFTDVRVQVGTDPSQNRDIAKAARIDAEIELIKFKERIEKSKK